VPPPLEAEYLFPEGLPAFESESRFRLVEPESLQPLMLLESLSTPGLRFVCVAVELLDPAYRLELADSDRTLLCTADSESGLRPLAIVTFPADGPPTANLRAPVVLNPAAGLGIQVIPSTNAYPVFHPLRPPAQASPSC
jgi:flagellar assembly factor FliW